MTEPFIRFECDKCGFSEDLTPQIFYRDYSGETPFVDLSDRYLEKLASKNRWEINGDECYCIDCQEVEEDDEAKDEQDDGDPGKDKSLCWNH